MFRIVIRKMLNNKWMVACLLIGSILAVAMVCCIPIYTYSSLQRLLAKDLDKYYTTNSVYPCGYNASADFSYKFSGADSIKAYNIFDNKISNTLIKDIKLPIIDKVKNAVVENLVVQPEKLREYNPTTGDVSLVSLTELQKHIKISNGRMYSTKNTDGIFEVVVSQEAMKNLDLRLDEVYSITPMNKVGNDTFKIRVVGVFDIKDATDPYWYKDINTYSMSFFMDSSLLKDNLLKNYNLSIAAAQWYYIFDYHKITISDMNSIESAYLNHTRWFDANDKVVTLDISSMEVFKVYSDREKQLKITLLVLQIPILMMLAFYIFMVSQLIIDQEKNEIAVLKSRGASAKQIFISYFIESLILSGIAIIIGPFIGLFICRILGASNGFLEFVNRAALPVSLKVDTYLYSLAAVAVFMATMLIPAFLASRTTIVQHKQQKAGIPKKPIWKKFFFDIILLGIACWGLYSYTRQQNNLAVTSVKATDMSIDPLLFLVSTLFILGSGLVLLRIFPYIIRLLFRIGKNKWSPVFYASFTQVGRSGGQEQFLMLFLILTLSIGIFSANAARTINSNTEDKIRYSIGADITMQPYWENNAPLPASGPLSVEEQDRLEQPIIYKEPKLTTYTNLKGVGVATKVFRKYDAMAQIGTDWAENVEMMAIVPDEFSKVSSLRPGLLPYHMNSYLNLLAKEQSAILVSRSFEKKYNVKIGDDIVFKWGQQQYIEGVVNAFIDYWPTFNPKQNANGDKDPYLIVANLSYVQALTTIEPYELWIKKKPEIAIGEMSNAMNADIAKQGLRVDNRKDVTQEITKMKNDPMLQSTNGALSMGFIVTMFISTIGFIIYWTLSIRKRVLQFGIFRAMGLSFKKLIGILVCEQVLISGTSILAGIIIGGLTSALFVPLFQLIYSSAQQVPPFLVISKQIDFIRIYSVLVLMIVIGFTVLGRLISKINVNQAIKLGED